MGARVYIPAFGRFLSVDSVEGGTDNNYVYANDPVNQSDLDGRALPILVGVLLWNAARVAAPHVARAAVTYLAKPAVQYVVKKTPPALVKKVTTTVSKKVLPAIKGGVSKATQNVRKVVEYTKSIRISVQKHSAHHSWVNQLSQKKLYFKHINIMVYRKGVRDSMIYRKQIPYGKGCVRMNCK